MVIKVKNKGDLSYADITPKGLYMGRRNFLLGALGTYGAVTAWKRLPSWFAGPPNGSVPRPLGNPVKSPFSTTENVTPKQDVETYNNFYEFGVDKGGPSRNARS